MISAQQQRIDKNFMRQAIELASRAASMGDVPVGAVLVLGGEVSGLGWNRCVADHDPTAHAEIMALRDAAKRQQCSRLDGATLYVTLEPCLMCSGALLQARIGRLVFGAREPRTGGIVSIHEALRLQGVDHHVAFTEGVQAMESVELLRSFFAQLRQRD